MKITPINFTGIKNTGYCWVNKEIGDNKFLKCSLNTQLTYSDKREYQNLMDENPRFRNKINPNFANIELRQYSSPKQVNYILKLNGDILDAEDETERPVINFINKLLNKIKTQNDKDFVVNKDYITGDDCHFGIIYNENFDRYMNGKDGTIGVCGNQIIPSKYHDDVLEILHEPNLVKGGAGFISTIFDVFRKL